MLLLATHDVDQVTAKVPFSVILLQVRSGTPPSADAPPRHQHRPPAPSPRPTAPQDLISNKKVPPQFKCRQASPRGGRPPLPPAWALALRHRPCPRAHRAHACPCSRC